MKNLIYVSVLFKQDYVKLLMLLFSSIHLYGNLDDNTDILIITSSKLKNIIESSLDEKLGALKSKVKYLIKDNLDTSEEAFTGRLYLYDYENIKDYSKILYLDSDILITRSLQDVFDLLEPDNEKIMAGAERNHYIHHGMYLFQERKQPCENFTGFNSGVLLFNNNESSKLIFELSKNDINATLKEQGSTKFFDQPYINFHCHVRNMIDYGLTYSITYNPRHYVNEPSYTICHFIGGAGTVVHKYLAISKLLDAIQKDPFINNVISSTKEYINLHLLPIVKNIGEPLEGNIFMFHHSYYYYNDFTSKQKNIVMVSSNKNFNNCLAIGFNAGFSSLLILNSNKNIKLTCVDICQHKYAIPCFNKLKEDFGDRIELIQGSSDQILPTLSDKNYDLIHIDGSHDANITELDIINSFNLSKPGTVFIMDDTNFHYLKVLWDKYVNFYKLKNPDFHICPTIHHDIKIRE
jgi:Lipopolysaccharide biosynthesis proteins, LPS:glycosyltransferases